jgi:hypothetical protein
MPYEYRGYVTALKYSEDAAMPISILRHDQIVLALKASREQ